MNEECIGFEPRCEIFISLFFVYVITFFLENVILPSKVVYVFDSKCYLVGAFIFLNFSTVFLIMAKNWRKITKNRQHLRNANFGFFFIIFPKMFVVGTWNFDKILILLFFRDGVNFKRIWIFLSYLEPFEMLLFVSISKDSNAVTAIYKCLKFIQNRKNDDKDFHFL